MTAYKPGQRIHYRLSEAEAPSGVAAEGTATVVKRLKSGMYPGRFMLDVETEVEHRRILVYEDEIAEADNE